MPLLANFSDQELCQTCAEEQTIICSHCGRRIWRTESTGNEETPLCRPCYERHYVTCVRCGNPVYIRDAMYESGDTENAYPYCPACYPQRGTGIHEYDYKPSPVFFGEGTRFFGVELEIDEGGALEHNARRILNAGNAGGFDHIYCKIDGSLDDGIEIVSHPMTLDYHMNVMPWCDVISVARKLHFTSHKANTCGLHIHVSRAAFGDTETEQDVCIARILYFFEKHWEELLKFSRRTQHQLEQWAQRYGYKAEPMEILDHAKWRLARSRYTCVNLTNRDTIEFRMFRGTLKLNTFLATLQLVDRICDLAVGLTDAELKAMSWTTFVADCDQPELIQYLKERRLYVNEQMNDEEEI